jgi:hypothetical protein
MKAKRKPSDKLPPARSFLYVQLLYTGQDGRGLELLRFPDQPILPKGCRISCLSWSKQGIVRRRYSKVRSIIADPGLSNLNRVEVSYNFARHPIPGTSIVVTKIRTILHVSPSSSLWAPTSGYEARTHRARMSWSSLERYELGLRQMKCSNYPTLYETLIDFEHSSSKDPTFDFFASLSDSIPRGLPFSQLSGCASVETIPPVMNMLQALGPWPKTHTMLGDLFDDLHPVLLGRPRLCLDLSNAITGSKFVEIKGSGGDASLGLVWLGEERSRLPKTRDAAARWLVPRDETTAYSEPALSDGEFQVGSHVLFTYKRYKELVDSDMLPTLPKDFVNDYLFEQKYFSLLNIDSDRVPVHLWQLPVLQLFRKEVDLAFSSLPQEMPLYERVWEAHEAALRKWVWGNDDEALSTLKKIYLSISDQNIS